MDNNKSLQKKALLLVWIGEIWNVLEATIALWSGIEANSVALFAFGLDSLTEIFAGAVLIWHLSKEWNGQEVKTEKKALKLVGFSFYLLAIYIIFHSSASLLGYLPRPEISIIGMWLIVASAMVMTLLYFKKIKIARELNSRALVSEAKHSLFCDLQDIPILIGLGLNLLFGWWWTDPLLALGLVPFILHEGKESFEESH